MCNFSLGYVGLVLVWIGFPDDAWAWGPITHLHFSQMILSNISNFPHDIAMLILRYPYDFLYGAISADIILGKKFMPYLHQGHNWKVALKIYQRANQASERSFACGYLSHLAADTIAHNYFLPLKLITSYRALSTGHLYWELRFDHHVATDALWQLLNEVSAGEYDWNDHLLESSLKHTIVSFKTHKRIFSGWLLLSRTEKIKRALSAVSDRSKWVLALSDVSEMTDMSITAIVDFLTNFETSPYFQIDPMGYYHLYISKGVRKRLRKLDREHGLRRGDGEAESRLKKLLKEKMFSRDRRVRVESADILSIFTR